MLDRDGLPDFGKAEVWETMRSTRALRDRLAVDELLLAEHLAGLYEGRTIAETQGMFRTESDRQVCLAGEGAPEISEYAAGELSGHLGITLHAARELLGDALEIAHRLPRLWQRMKDGYTQAWRVRAVAAETRELSQEAAAWVDVMLTHPEQRRQPNTAAPQLVDEAIRRFDPVLFAQREQDKSDGRGVWVDHDKAQGITRRVGMVLDAPDARLLDETLDDLASVAKACGDTDSQQVRRAKAVGTLLNPQLALDLMAGTLPDDEGGSTSRSRKSVAARTRTSVVYVHLRLSDLATLSTTEVDRGATLEKYGPVTVQRLAEWFTRRGGIAEDRLIVRPVLDMETDWAVDQHDPPGAMRELVVLRDRVCVFPGCTLDARGCDLDHTDPYVPLDEGGPPGQTNPLNLAALCRAHHRLKTHGGWRYRRTRDGKGRVRFQWYDRWGRPVGEHLPPGSSPDPDPDPPT